jgi:hypothetical protein
MNSKNPQVTEPTPDQTYETEISKLKGEEPAKLRATTAASDGQKSLDRLFDYTKFHIGLYLTLTTSYVAVASLKNGNEFLFKIDPRLFWPATVCFMLAGLAGGIIASSLTQTQARSTATFLTERLGPWSTKVFETRTWTWIEHTAFWLGLVLALFSLRSQ